MAKRRKPTWRRAQEVYERIESEGRKITTFELTQRLNVNKDELGQILYKLRRKTGKKYPTVGFWKMKNIGIVELKKDFRFGKWELRVLDTYTKLRWKLKRVPTFVEIRDAGKFVKRDVVEALKRIEEKTGLRLNVGDISEEERKKIHDSFPYKVDGKIFKEARRVESSIEEKIRERIEKTRPMTEKELHYFIKKELPSLGVSKYFDIGVAKEIIEQNRKRWKWEGLIR